MRIEKLEEKKLNHQLNMLEKQQKLISSSKQSANLSPGNNQSSLRSIPEKEFQDWLQAPYDSSQRDYGKKIK